MGRRKGNNFFFLLKYYQLAAVVAQLVVRALPTPEVRGSNLVVGKILFMYSLSTVLKRLK